MLRSNPYHDKILEKQQQHECLTQILQSKGFTVRALPMLLGNLGEIIQKHVKNHLACWCRCRWAMAEPR